MLNFGLRLFMIFALFGAVVIFNEPIAVAADSNLKTKGKNSSSNSRKTKKSIKSKTKGRRKSGKAKAGKKKIELGPSQKATVIIDGAMVYQGASFDAPVLTYLREGQELSVSQKVYGAFYRVALSPTVMGYISDVDVRVAGQDFNAGVSDTALDSDKTTSPSNTFSQRAIFDILYLGGTFGTVFYAEPLGGQEPADMLTTYGFKASGPGIVLDGPFTVDFTMKLFTSPPEYYGILSATEPTGMGIYADTVIVLPYAEWKWGAIYYGGGLEFLYTDFTITRSNTSLFLKELKLGVVGMVGTALRWQRWALKFEAKGYYDRTIYGGWEVSLQYALR